MALVFLFQPPTSLQPLSVTTSSDGLTYTVNLPNGDGQDRLVSFVASGGHWQIVRHKAPSGGLVIPDVNGDVEVLPG